MSVDEQLLARNNSVEEDNNEAVSAGNFRSTKRGADEEDSLAYNFRETVRRAKSLNKESLRRQISRESRDNNLRQLTDSILRFAWQNLITSWGLTIFLIDAHVFLNKVFGPTAFRELGEEWIPASIKKLGAEKTKEAAGLLTITEKIGCGCLNLGCLIIVIGALSVMSMIAVAMEHPLETLWDVWLKDGLSDFVNMIKSLL